MVIESIINKVRFYRDTNPLKFFGIIGTIFLGTGFLIGAWLIGLFLTTGSVGHYPSIILSVLLMITGIQILCFAFLADMR